MRYTIQDMQLLAAQKGGQCLSNDYNPRRLEWQCQFGHRWQARPSSVVAGSWCKQCVANELKLSIKDAQKVALERSGKCLSRKYVNARQKLKWKCADGHVWTASYSSVYSGSWCPKCVGSRWFNEEKCRYVIEQITRHKFPKYRVDKFELDGHNTDLQLAFEYQGAQHYYDNVFGSHSLKRVCASDKNKEIICSERGITLIHIPYWEAEKGDKNLVRFLCEKLNQETLDLNFENFYKTHLSCLYELRDIATANGGYLLSDEYLGSNHRLRWQCKYGHIWEATPAKIKSGRWCHDCRYKRMWETRPKHSIQELRDIALQHGGECLSSEYKGLKVKLKWRCQLGHEWETTPANILEGRWCIKCKKIKTHRKNTLL